MHMNGLVRHGVRKSLPDPSQRRHRPADADSVRCFVRISVRPLVRTRVLEHVRLYVRLCVRTVTSDQDASVRPIVRPSVRPFVCLCVRDPAQTLVRPSAQDVGDGVEAGQHLGFKRMASLSKSGRMRGDN
jgi:hypothetical protein